MTRTGQHYHGHTIRVVLRSKDWTEHLCGSLKWCRFEYITGGLIYEHINTTTITTVILITGRFHITHHHLVELTTFSDKSLTEVRVTTGLQVVNFPLIVPTSMSASRRNWTWFMVSWRCCWYTTKSQIPSVDWNELVETVKSDILQSATFRHKTDEDCSTFTNIFNLEDFTGVGFFNPETFDFFEPDLETGHVGNSLNLIQGSPRPEVKGLATCYIGSHPELSVPGKPVFFTNPRKFFSASRSPG